MVALRILGHGDSADNYVDSYQMGESTILECISKMSNVFDKSETLQEKFLKVMTKNDARELCRLHKEKHQIDGMLGSFDYVHFVWRNCPVALQGDHKDKDGNFSLVMEAVSDQNLHIWFPSIGWAGTQNDLYIWAASPLHRCILEGYFDEELDFEFEIGEERFF